MSDAVAKRWRPRWRRRPSPWLVLGVIAFLGLGATVAAAYWAHRTTDTWVEDLLFEVARAGVQIFAIGVLGGAAAAAWRAREARREARAKVREELVAVVGLYNDVKRVRRILKSQGLDLGARRSPDPPVDHPEQFTNQQVEVFHAQMLALTDLQLQFESKVRQFGQTNLLGKDTGEVVELLGQIETHLHKVLKQAWEQRAWTVRTGSDVSVVSDALQPLFRKRSFRDNMTTPLQDITRLINAHVFSGASDETREVLDDIDERDRQFEDALEPDDEDVSGPEPSAR